MEPVAEQSIFILMAKTASWLITALFGLIATVFGYLGLDTRNSLEKIKEQQNEMNVSFLNHKIEVERNFVRESTLARLYQTIESNGKETKESIAELRNDSNKNFHELRKEIKEYISIGK